MFRLGLSGLFCATIVLGTLIPLTTPNAQERTPLLMEGKSTLFQRVLTRPGAMLAAEPTPAGAAAAIEVPSFSTYYVYDRKVIDGADWLEAGTDSRGTTIGWVTGDLTIDWKQSMVVAFGNPAGRNRTLLFADRDRLIDLLETETLVRDVERLHQMIADGKPVGEEGVISVEPAAYVDFREEFYLLPILAAEEVYLSSGFATRVLEVASVTEMPGEEEHVDDPDVRARLNVGIDADSAAAIAGDSVNDYRTGIAFVVDTTTSMDPYIDRARELIQAVIDALETDGIADKVAFALIGFRDNLAATPELDYVSRTFADFEAGQNAAEFFDKVAAAKAATVSSKGFIEDTYAGLLEAIDGLDWEGFDDRNIILITDAGARRANDPLGQTAMDAEQLRSLALEKGIAVTAFHLLTREGTPNHRSAEAQYSALTDHPNAGSLYFGIDAGSVDVFGLLAAVAAQSIAKRIADNIGAEAGAVDAALADTVEQAEASGAGEQVADVLRKSEAVGHAMRLAYLGRQTGSSVPRLFHAWLADRDMVNPDIPALEVRVLLTKNQLSDLQQVLEAVMEAGEAAELGSEEFFNQIRSAAAAMGRDPSLIGREEARNLSELGIMGEFLDDLPYESKVMSIDTDLWHSGGITKQQEFLDEIRAKIELYELHHDNSDHWIALNESDPPGEHVYPMPLEDLP